jgi:YidC/Oxa1 family membrane protein insertase
MVINLILLPLNLFGSKSFKKYADFQKKLAYLQQRYKNDPDTLARERAELINKNGMPGAAGCLPKLLQLPIFFALSRVLSSAIQLYKAPFLWISDLSATDPYYILPVLIGSSMLFLAPTNDPKQRFTMIAMALFFGAFSANLSAGLSLYIFVGVLLGVIQNFFQQKMGWA